MGSRPEYEESREIADLDELSRRPRLLYVTLTWHVYERDETGELPLLVEVVRDLHVLIDRVTGRRIVVRDADLDGDARFVDLAQQAECCPLVYSVTRKQLELITDERHRIIAAFGGERGGKTQSAGLKVVRWWLRMGGRAVRLWWVAPTQEQTAICTEKLVTGEDTDPPLLPPMLVYRYPKSKDARDQRIVLIDGTAIELRYANGHRRGGNLKGRGPRAIAIDEACEIADKKVWKIIRGRVNFRGGHKGQIFLSSTPEEGHWAESEIVGPVDRARAGEEDEAANDATYGHLTMVDNAWIPLSEVESLVRDKGGPEDPQCQRDVFGRWASSTGRAYYRYDARRHIRRFVVSRDTDGMIVGADLEDLDLVDVTDAVVRARWPRLAAGCRTDLVAGQDFNVGHCVTVICKFGVARATGYRTDQDLVVVVVAELVTKVRGYEEHGWDLRRLAGPIPVACDSTGAFVGRREPGHREATSHARRLATAGHDVRPCYIGHTGEPANPSVGDSLEQTNDMLGHQAEGLTLRRVVIHPDCGEVHNSLQRTLRRPDDTIAKEAGKASDRLSAAGDCLRYFLAFHQPAGLSGRQAAA